MIVSIMWEVSIGRYLDTSMTPQHQSKLFMTWSKQSSVAIKAYTRTKLAILLTKPHYNGDVYTQIATCLNENKNGGGTSK